MASTVALLEKQLTSLRTDWRRWAEPWYLAYALLGAVIGGLMPILLPLAMNQRGGAAQVGLVMAALNLGGLFSPLWGALADRSRLYRWLLVGGLLVTALGILLFLFAQSALAWYTLALIQGMGAAGAATLANLLVVETHPRREWDQRIGWLQTAYGAGQVVGLLLAGLLSQAHPSLGFLIAAGLAVVALIPAWRAPSVAARRLRVRPLLSLVRHTRWHPSAPLRYFHFPRRLPFRHFGRILRSPFGIFLLSWFLALSGSIGFFALYPVLMQQAFQIDASVSSTAMAVAVGIGLFFYPLAARWSERLGPVRVFRSALAVRTGIFFLIFALGALPIPGRGWLALIVFTGVVLSWSLLSVSGTALTAHISPVGEGEGLGFYNATAALAGVVGSGMAGSIAAGWSYTAVPLFSAVSVGLGLLLALALPGDPPENTDPAEDGSPPGKRSETGSAERQSKL